MASNIVEKLSDVKNQDDFKVIYKHMGLKNNRDRISFLKNETGIISIRPDRKLSLSILLAELEDYILSHPWRV